MTNFEFMVDGFMLYCSSKNLAKKTLASYEQSLKLFGMFLKDKFNITEIDMIHTNHIRHYIKNLQERGKYTVSVLPEKETINSPKNRGDYNKKISTNTISNYTRNIKVFFNWLHKVEREISKNPVEKIENIKPEIKQKKTLTPEELKNVFKSFNASTFHGFRNLIISKLLLDTGMRIGECLTLLPENVDLLHKSILITNPKNKQQRYVYFSSKMSTELKRWFQYRDRYSDSNFLFPTTKATQLSIQNFEKSLKEAGKSVGIDIHPHQLRNNFAKYYILFGGDFSTLSKILGHSSVEVTQKAYLDFTDDEIRKKYQKHSPLNNMDI